MPVLHIPGRNSLRLLGAFLVAVALLASTSADNGRAGLILPFSNIRVDTTSDNNVRDSVLSLREAMLLADGALLKTDLMPAEADNVMFTPGPGAADAILFDSTVFPTNTQTTITLISPLPTMLRYDSVSANGNAINGTSNVKINGNSNTYCFFLAAEQNNVSGLEITGCDIALWVDGDSNRIMGNTIMQNTTGVWLGVTNSAAMNTVENNIINRNTDFGVQITRGGSNYNVIRGNMIGTDREGVTDLGNQFGVAMDDNARLATIGGDSPEERNVISGNQTGVILSGEDVKDNVISGNYIGTTASGDQPLPNTRGVSISFSNSNIVGGDSPGERNVISGNTDTGVRVVGATNDVIGNYIGTDATGTNAIGNGKGVTVNGGLSDIALNEVGKPGQGNLISGNLGAGVTVDFAGFTAVSGNMIGTDASGSKPLGNGGPGVTISSSHDTAVGAVGPGLGNTLAFNGGAGVEVLDFGMFPTDFTAISGNSIHSNGGLGIDLLGDGVTDNDDADPDTGPNTLQNFPVLESAASPPLAAAGESGLEITGTINSNASAEFLIELFRSDDCDLSSHGEGKDFIGSILTPTTDAGGDADFSLLFALTEHMTGFITATAANDDTNETSEFSECIEIIGPATPTPTPSPEPTPTPTPGAKTATPTETPPGSETPTATPRPTPTPRTPGTATPTIAPEGLTQGNVDCDKDVDSVDALFELRDVAGLPVNQPKGCPEIGSEVASLFGDVDCDEDVDSVDALFVLRFVAALPFVQQEPCPDMGQPLGG